MASQGQTRIGQALDELKEAGSSLLIVGTVPEERFGEMSETLLGDPAAGPRRRLFVTTDGRVEEVKERLPEQPLIPNRQGVRVIEISETVRGSVTVEPDSHVPLPSTRLDVMDIDGLAQTILETIDEFDRLAAGLQPSELRMSVAPLARLIDSHGQEPVFRMIHVLNHIVREKDGIAHYHLPVQRESGLVRMLRSLFDAVIELRLQKGQLQQRWHLQDPGTSSDWLPI